MHGHDPREAPVSSEFPAATLEATSKVLTQLPREQRELVILLGFYRMTRDEISVLMGQPISRIDSLFRASVRSLRMILAGSPRPSFG
jgi:DNA-directed RNA polymerase specialized sigma24 family protein